MVGHQRKIGIWAFASLFVIGLAPSAQAEEAGPLCHLEEIVYIEPNLWIPTIDLDRVILPFPIGMRHNQATNHDEVLVYILRGDDAGRWYGDAVVHPLCSIEGDEVRDTWNTVCPDRSVVEFGVTIPGVAVAECGGLANVTVAYPAWLDY